MRKISLSVIIFFLSFLILEVFLRVVNPWGVRYFINETEMDNRLYELGNNKGMTRQLRSNVKEVIGGVTYFTNAYHVRDFPLPENKDALSEIRILILGDSVVFGIGVPLEYTFAKRFEYFLNIVNPEKKYRVIPAGVIKYNTKEEYNFIKEYGEFFKPDVIMTLYVGNDNIDHSNWRNYLEILERKDFSSIKSTLTYLRYAMVEKLRYSLSINVLWCMIFKKALLKIRMDNPRRVDNSIVYENIKNIKEWSKRRKIPLIIISYDKSDFLEQICSDYHIPLYDISLSKEKKILFRNSIIDSHPNRFGHLKLTRNLVAQLSKTTWSYLFFGKEIDPLGYFDKLFAKETFNYKPLFVH